MRVPYRDRHAGSGRDNPGSGHSAPCFERVAFDLQSARRSCPPTAISVTGQCPRDPAHRTSGAHRASRVSHCGPRKGRDEIRGPTLRPRPRSANRVSHPRSAAPPRFRRRARGARGGRAGTGQHAAFFARQHCPGPGGSPPRRIRARSRRFAAWAEFEGVFQTWGRAGPARRPPRSAGRSASSNVVYCANMISHCAVVLLHRPAPRGGDGTWSRGGFSDPLRSPSRWDGHHTSPSNVAFDRSLRAQDPRWGSA